MDMFYQQIVHLDNILYGEKVRVSVHVRPRFFLPVLLAHLVVLIQY